MHQHREVTGQTQSFLHPELGVLAIEEDRRQSMVQRQVHMAVIAFEPDHQKGLTGTPAALLLFPDDDFTQALQTGPAHGGDGAAVA